MISYHMIWCHMISTWDNTLSSVKVVSLKVALLKSSSPKLLNKLHLWSEMTFWAKKCHCLTRNAIFGKKNACGLRPAKKTSFFTKRTLRARGKIYLFLWQLVCDRTTLPPSKPTTTTIPIKKAHDIAWNATLGVQQLALPSCCNAAFLPEQGGVAVSC